MRPAVAAPGEARHDSRIVVDVARRLEALLPPRRADGTALFGLDTPESLWNEHRESTRGRDLDITGLSYAMLERDGPQQWPLREGEATGAQRLYADGQFATPDGRAQFAAVAARPLAEKRDAPYPFSLNTGRLRDHWHGLSRTGTLGRLYGHASEPTVDMHPSDLARLRLASGDLVQVKSRRGALVLPVSSSTSVAPAQAFIAMHWGDEVLGGRHRGGINALTSPAFCPQSKQPELKHAAVKLEKLVAPWQMVSLRRAPTGAGEQTLALHAALQPFDALRRRPVREGIRHDAAARGLLQPVVADRLRGRR